MSVSSYSFPTAIWSGPGARNELGQVLAEATVRHPILITDRMLATLPPAAQVRDAVVGAGLEVGLFAEVGGNPGASQVVAGVEAYRTGNHDGIIALGGAWLADSGEFLPDFRSRFIAVEKEALPHGHGAHGAARVRRDR